MVRITQQTNAVAAKHYHRSASEYYGAGEQEIVGRWSGQAAERLGLEGVIEQPHFARLCDNLHPFTGEQLTARMRKDRRIGYDFTFDASKSVSLLYGLTGDALILDAFRQAAAEVMDRMEHGVTVRVRKRGQFGERRVGNWVVAEYIHFTARPVGGLIDPHLHGHFFVPNLAWDGVEHQWKAIDVASIKEGAPHWQAMFQKRFGQRLSELGYNVAWKGDNFEIAGIERPLIEKFSRRTRLIEGEALRRGVTDASDKDKLGLMTRERKRKDATMPQLRAEWRNRLTDDERAALAKAALRQRHFVPSGHAARPSLPSIEPIERPIPLRGHAMQRQRIAAHERARASCVAPGPVHGKIQGYGR